MDGFGINPDTVGNAIYSANTPRLDKIFAECPHTQIGASGMDVGLPDGQMGGAYQNNKIHKRRRFLCE